MALAKKPFVVLDAEILSSSVWSAAAHVRLVWITLLILCDTEGYVGASIPGIASAAGVSVAQAEDAIAIFKAPDPYSRTKKDDGRRLEDAERGFRVLNFIAHLERLSAERTKARDRVRRFRERQKKLKMTDGNVTVPTGNREQGVGNKENNGVTSSVADAPVAAPAWSSEACEDWQQRFGGTVPGGRIGKALKPLVSRYGWETIRPAWKRYLAEKEPEFATPQDFAAKLGEWLHKRIGSAKGQQFVDRTKAVLSEWLQKRSTAHG